MLKNGVYKGGKVCYVDNCIHDYLSLLDLKKIGIDLGYKVDITQRVTSLKVYYKGPAKSGQHVVNEVINDSCIPGLVGSISSDQVLVLYYHDPTHNNELESEDKGQQQHSEDVGNVDEYEWEENWDEEEEEEEEEKEYVIVDSDYEISEEEENGNKEAASRAQPRNDAPNDEYAQCFEEMNEMPLNEATGEISDDDEDSDQLPSDVESSGDEEEGQKKTSKRKWKRTNFKQFRKETDLRNPEFRIGMQFANKDELKEAIKEYAIVQGRNIKLVKNDNRRIQAKCATHTKCPFILWASKIDRDEQTFAIKTLSLEHECTRVDKLKYTNSRWLSKRFADKIRKNPDWDVGAFKAEVLERYHMNVSNHQIYRVKNLSKVIIEGSYVEQYARLWDYAEELKKVNKGSTVIIKNKMKGNKPMFERIYVLFMSDKQKGLIHAIETLLPIAEHRMCVRHLYSNFRTEHGGLALKNILWAAARAITIPWYEAEMDKMKEQDEEAWKHPVGPRIVKIIEKNKLGASQCILRLAGDNKYQEANVFDYAHDFYKKESYLSSYEPMVHPIPSMDQWQRTNWPPIKPPPYKKQLGRPKKSRNKGPADVEVPAPVPPNPLPPFYNPPPTRLRRIYVKIRCSICGQEGHNKTRHANLGTSQAHPNQPNPTRGRGRGKGTTTGRRRGNQPNITATGYVITATLLHWSYIIIITTTQVSCQEIQVSCQET
ncbi:unnamed protein product [Prunus brigantina]